MAFKQQPPRYSYPIVAFLLIVTVLYLFHLLTGVTPPRAIFTIAALDFPVYWYGVWIMGGMVLGAYVVADLVRVRGIGLFEQAVPLPLREIPLSQLPLVAPVAETLPQHSVTTIGELLYQWGMNPLELGVKPTDLPAIAAALRTVAGVEGRWLEDAPWRQWNPEHVWNGLVWCLIPAVVGARLYHVLTPSPSMAALGIESPLDYLRHPYQLINLRNGGLGIYGGIVGGALGLWLYTRQQRLGTVAWADVAVIGLVLGQAVGRWGNFFNQELYGRPTQLPWAVTIDPEYRLPAYADVARFHPAFLYESVWNFAAFLLLLWLYRRRRLRPGELTGLYLLLYAVGRVLLETVRLDSRMVLLGGLALPLPVATLVSLLLALVVGLWLLWRRRGDD